MNPIKIYQKYIGNFKGDKVTVFKDENSYRFVYQKFIRTNPSQAERKNGFKPKRVIQSESIFELPNLKNIEYSQYPFSHLMTGFNPENTYPEP